MNLPLLDLFGADQRPQRVRPERDKVLPGVRANAGIEAAYRRALAKMIEEMNDSVVYWVSAAYKANEPEIAQDESPAAALRASIRKLAARWIKRFDEGSIRLAKYFAKSISDRSDAALKQILKDAGFSIEWRMTRAQNDVLQAVVQENVSLIRSILSQYFTQIEGFVMRSVQTGRDMSQLAKDLQRQYGVTKRRAALIARDQNEKATANLTRARQLESGLTTALWMHSSAGKEPRPSHVANNGKSYDIRKGWWDPNEREWIVPGQNFQTGRPE